MYYMQERVINMPMISAYHTELDRMRQSGAIVVANDCRQYIDLQ